MNMKNEFSSGAVVVKKQGNQMYVLCIRDMNGNLTFPKGKIEKGEDPKDTAIRETDEETGMTGLTFVSELSPVRYIYTRNHEKIAKTVYFSLFFYKGRKKGKPQKEEGISEIIWLPIYDAIDKIGYPRSNKAILEEAKKHI